MEIVVDFVSAKDGLELSIVGDEVIQTYRFMKWSDDDDDTGRDKQLSTILSTVDSPKLYAYGDEKCAFLSERTGRTFLNLERLGCPRLARNKYHCDGLFAHHKLPKVRCAARNAQSLYDWLKAHRSVAAAP